MDRVVGEEERHHHGVEVKRKQVFAAVLRVGRAPSPSAARAATT
jgi:hypothetical protein